MKFARISLATFMLMAIVLRSLPDTVFDYFHEHHHYQPEEQKTRSGASISEFQHNCHIQDWNFESFEVSETHYQPLQVSNQEDFCLAQPGFSFIISVTQNGRAPPIA